MAYVLGSELWEYDFDHLLISQLSAAGVTDARKHMVITHVLVNFSPWLRSCSWLESRGKLMVNIITFVALLPFVLSLNN